MDNGQKRSQPPKGFERVSTSTQGKWIAAEELVAGKVITGRLTGAFTISKGGEDPRVVYTIEDGDGQTWNLSERHALQGLRLCHIGDHVWIECHGKRQIEGGQTMHGFDLAVRRTEVSAPTIAESLAAKAGAAKSTDIPF